MTDQLLALEAATTNDMVRINSNTFLNTLLAVRKSIMEAESREKIQQPPRSNVWTYDADDSVYYRRQNYKGWYGPAKVLGKEGQCVLIRYRGAFYRMHLCHLMKLNKEFRSPRSEENKISSNEINEVLEEEDEQHNKSPNRKHYYFHFQTNTLGKGMNPLILPAMG